MDIFSFTSDGKVIEGTGAVFPICEDQSDGTVKYHGTGFFISNNGIFITAKHVLEDTSSPFIIHMRPNNEYYRRQIIRADLTHRGDLAVGIVEELKDSAGNILINDRLQLSSHIPKPTEAISTFAYPESTMSFHEVEGETRNAFNIIPRQYSGVVVKVETGGIKRITPSPAVICTIDSLPGNSGGPVFSVDGKGGVIGINTFGMQGVYHVVSLIDEVRALKIDGIILPGLDKPNTLTVDQLISIGAVSFVRLDN